MATISISIRKHVVPAIFSAVVAVGGAGSVIANAAPGVWDIESFDSCTELLNDGLDESLQERLDDTKYCCTHTGGVWNEGQQTCQGPPAQEAQAPQAPRPLRPLGPFEETKVATTPTTTTTIRPLPGLPDGVLPPKNAG
jgi:hypothetical protein